MNTRNWCNRPYQRKQNKDKGKRDTKCAQEIEIVEFLHVVPSLEPK